MEQKQSYSNLKDIYQDKLAIISNNHKLIWAFNEKQLEDGLKEFNVEKKDLVSIGAGGYMPRANINSYIEENKKLNEWFVEEVKKLNPNEVIIYELNNYECYYTGDITDAYEVLREYGFNKEDVLNVFHNKNYDLSGGQK